MTTPDAGQRLIEDLLQLSPETLANALLKCQNHIDRQEIEIERLRGVEADAQRYRALRDCPQHACIWPTVFMANDEAEPTTGDPLFGETLDKAADAAIAASRSTGAADVGEDNG